jgi:chromate transporter
MGDSNVTRRSGKNQLLDLYLTFAKIGATTIGGGYAMLPVLQDEIVTKRGWATESEIMDYYAIGQCTPGIIAVNTSTFIGYRKAGILGGVLATLGFVTPSIIIITIIAFFLQNFAEYPVVQHAFNGIRACVCVLILDAVLKLGKKALTDYRCVLIFVAVLAAALFTPLSPVLFVILAGVAGVILMPRKKPEKTGDEKASDAGGKEGTS